MLKINSAAFAAFILSMGYASAATTTTYNLSGCGGLSVGSFVNDQDSRTLEYLNPDDFFSDPNYGLLLTVGPLANPISLDLTAGPYNGTNFTGDGLKATLSLTGNVALSFTQSVMKSFGTQFGLKLEPSGGGLDFTSFRGTVPGGVAPYSDTIYTGNDLTALSDGSPSPIPLPAGRCCWLVSSYFGD